MATRELIFKFPTHSIVDQAPYYGQFCNPQCTPKSLDKKSQCPHPRFMAKLFLPAFRVCMCVFLSPDITLFGITLNADLNKLCTRIHVSGTRTCINSYRGSRNTNAAHQPSGVIISILTHTNPWGRSGAITRLTTHFTRGLMSDLVICKHIKVWGYTRYRIFLLIYQMPLNKTTQFDCILPCTCIWLP